MKTPPTQFPCAALSGLVLVLALATQSSAQSQREFRDADSRANAWTGFPKTAPVRPTSSRASVAEVRAATASPSSTYGQVPLAFELNQGQTDAEVRFLGRGQGYSLFLTPAEAVLSLRGASGMTVADADSRRLKSDPRRSVRPDAMAAGEAGAAPLAVLRLKLSGANPSPKMTGLDERPGKSHYLNLRDPGRNVTNVAHFAKVRYEQVYPGIDAVFYSQQRQLEYDFTVAPGADPNAIALEFEGADQLELDGQGNLVVHLGEARLVQHAPVIYQVVNGKRREVRGGYALHRGGRRGGEKPALVGFELAAYDHDRPLVIDPVLSYATYLGGSADDLVHGIAVDGDGNAYVTGETHSSNFPTRNPLHGYGGGAEIFVTKLNPTGTDVVYSTYLGGNPDRQVGNGIAIDGSRRAYVTGETGTDAFLLRLNATGNGVDYSQVFGGSSTDGGSAVAVDSGNVAYVVGWTASTDFPTTNAIQATFGGGVYDGFLRKYDAAGTLLLSTYLGGSASDEAWGVKVDSSGKILIAGVSGFASPTGSDAFLLKLNNTASAVEYTYTFGGSGDDAAMALAVDGGNNVYVVGYTYSTNFPTQNAIQPFSGGDRDGFLRKYDANGTLLYSTYLGGSTDQAANAIALDAAANLYIVGYNYLANAPYGLGNGFCLVLNNAANQVLASMNFGTSGGAEEFTCIAMNGNDAYIGGSGYSAGFPITSGAFQVMQRGGYDGIVMKLTPGGPDLAVNDVAVLEGDSGLTNAVFTVSLSAPNALPVGVEWVTGNGTAQRDYGSPNGDYVNVGGSLTFNPGETSKTFSVSVRGDTQIEPDEIFYVVLRNPTNASVVKPVGTCTIVNDDFPAVSISDVSVLERDTGQTTNAVFNVTLSQPGLQTLTLHYATANGTAVAPTDYTATSGTLTFLPGETNKSVTVVVQGDLLNEATETFFVNLSNPTNGTLAKAQGVGTILDNDPLPSLSINNVTVTEPDTGTVNAVFTVTLTPVSGRTVTVNYATANGTATAPADYTAVASTLLTFNAGETSKPVTVVVKGDLLPEPNETFFVNLSGAVNATLADAQGLGTILDNDQSPPLNLGWLAPNWTLEWPTSYAGFTLERTGQLRPTNTAWTVVTNPVAVVGSTNRVLLPATASNNFFRLRKP